ncbi:hypothetical protein [Caballeronia sp. LZ032]|uniref:hypothetical protein n=1 Tax=Caballeronia sp. LZ032 TaxID=3038565 RepID=UPI00285ED940|nr:hypothetical protein [Caballeronia sp. LZ032]MDR5879038.1 hypothetical protein [Caballeronia sp. LZ032]
MKKQQPQTVTVKFRGYFAAKIGADLYQLRGRGERRNVSHAELVSMLNARPKKRVSK